jgi:hypothetical protein
MGTIEDDSMTDKHLVPVEILDEMVGTIAPARQNTTRGLDHRKTMITVPPRALRGSPRLAPSSRR